MAAVRVVAVVVVVKINKVLVISIVVAIIIITGFFILTGTLNANATPVNTDNLEKLTLRVSIPCPGHAYLIKQSLNGLNGVEKIEYSPITTFVVFYDSNKTSEQDILNLDIFKDYPAKKVG